MTRKKVTAGFALSAGALLSAAGFVVPGPAVAADGPAALTDGVADTIDRNTNEKLASARTDIIGATVESGAQGIVLTFKTQEMVDPATDPNWASKNTFVTWQLDSNADGKPESLIRFSADRDTPGALLGEATHFPGPGQPAKRCEAPASFNPATGYSLVIPPSCLNNPASFTYRVQLTYDTDPAAPKPPLAFDVAPDQGLAGPVSIVIPTAPAEAPPAGEPPAPSGAPTPPPTESAAPPAADPAPAGAAAPKAPAPAKKPAAKAAPKPSPAKRDSASASAPKPAGPAAPAETSPALAATGPTSTRWLGALGGALLLLGGLSLMAPTDRRQPTG